MASCGDPDSAEESRSWSLLLRLEDVETSVAWVVRWCHSDDSFGVCVSDWCVEVVVAGPFDEVRRCPESI